MSTTVSTPSQHPHIRTSTPEDPTARAQLRNRIVQDALVGIHEVDPKLGLALTKMRAQAATLLGMQVEEPRHQVVEHKGRVSPGTHRPRPWRPASGTATSTDRRPGSGVSRSEP